MEIRRRLTAKGFSLKSSSHNLESKITKFFICGIFKRASVFFSQIISHETQHTALCIIPLKSKKYFFFKGNIKLECVDYEHFNDFLIARFSPLPKKLLHCNKSTVALSHHFSLWIPSLHMTI